MKKVKILLSSMAVIVAVGASLATNTAKSLVTLHTNVAIKGLAGCAIQGTCAFTTNSTTCKAVISSVMRTLATLTGSGTATCSVAALGTFHAID